MNSTLKELYLSGWVIFMYYDLIEKNDDWMIFMWWIMEQDWRFRSMWDWRGIEDEFHSHKIEFEWRSSFYVLWFDWDEWRLNDIYVMDYGTRLEIQEHVELEKDWRWIQLSQNWFWIWGVNDIYDWIWWYLYELNNNNGRNDNKIGEKGKKALREAKNSQLTELLL